MITKTQSDVLWGLVCKYERAIQDSTRNEGCKFFEGRQDYACELLFNFVTSITAAKSEEPADDGWIAWAGGEWPVDSLEVKRRDGQFRTGGALEFRWDHRQNDFDIIAYRMVKP